MDDRDERSERIRQEVEQGREDPLREDDAEGGGEGGLVGMADRVAGRVARIATADTQAHGPGDMPDVELTGTPAPETGHGETLELTRDEKRQMHLGDEIAVRLPMESPEQGWTYEIDGDYRALDVYERAGLVTPAGMHHQAPGASGGTQFVVRAAERGKATVRFERLDRSAADSRPLHLKIKVR